MPMTCPNCHRVTTILAKHLRRWCGRFDTDDQRKATLATARQNLMKIASKGGTIKYEDIMSLGSLENVVPFLENRGFLVLNKPTPRTVRDVETQTPSTSAEQAPTEESPTPMDDGQDRERNFQESLRMLQQSPTVSPYGVAGSPPPMDPEDFGDRLETDERIGSIQVGEIGESQSCDSDIADPVEASEDVCADIPTCVDPGQAPADIPTCADPGQAPADIPTCADPGQAPVHLAEETDDSSAMENEDEEGPSTLDLQTQKILQTKWSTDVRKKMKTAGLYKRHSLTHPILQRFADYLQNTLRVQNYKQEVENVARFLYFMDPEQVTLNFVLNIERANKFFNKLQDLKLASQTIFNYLKHLKRFIQHQLRATNLAHENRELYNAFKIFKGVTKTIQARLSRGISKEVVGKRYKALNTLTMTAAEAQKILDVAKPDFLKCLRKICAGSKVKEQQLQILNYLECLLVLKHGQRPGVVQHMSVSEWKERVQHQYKGEDFVVIGVKEHKTSTQQVASFVLTPTEEEWFNVYFTHVRPVLSSTENPEDPFFLSTKGNAIYNVTNDMNRFHRKYKLPLVTSQMVRKLLETWTNSRCTDVQQRLVARAHVPSFHMETRSRQKQLRERSSSRIEEPRTSQRTDWRMNPVVMLKRL
ncbi:uncharacterized protein LOC143790632 isoform X2 [Ranitomeya variabilis]|uniref:uncharacterized protein LOC143784323 isoform X2 n=1 Tax=Ranitomeya variabilis TaxID=490064 RepID=UPI004056C92E